MLKSSSWPTSKTPSPHPSTSPAASLDIKRRSSMHQPLWTSSLGLGSTSPRATWPSTQAMSRATITIAGSEAAISHNSGINESEQISGTGNKSFEGKIAAPAGTDHKGPPNGKPAGPPMPAALAQQQHVSAVAVTSHEEEKRALIAAVVGVGLVALWLLRRFGTSFSTSVGATPTLRRLC